MTLVSDIHHMDTTTPGSVTDTIHWYDNAWFCDKCHTLILQRHVQSVTDITQRQTPYTDKPTPVSVTNNTHWYNNAASFSDWQIPHIDTTTPSSVTDTTHIDTTKDLYTGSWIQQRHVQWQVEHNDYNYGMLNEARDDTTSYLLTNATR